MADDQLLEAFDSRVKRRSERREFFKAAIGAAAVGAHRRWSYARKRSRRP